LYYYKTAITSIHNKPSTMLSWPVIFPAADVELVFADGGTVAVGLEVGRGSELVALPAGAAKLVGVHEEIDTVSRPQASANS
jgi:hypothetical protein